MPEHQIQLPAGKFKYREWGTQNANTIVLLHGMGRDSSDWIPTAQALAQNWRVLALDFRGHGESVRTPTYSLEALRDDFAAFAEALELESFALLGFSLGGVVAYLYAQDFPGRVTHLMTVDVPLPTDWEQPAPPIEAPARVRHDWQATLQIFPELHRTNPNWWTNLSRISCPALLLRGGSESWMPQDQIERTAGHIPDARVIEIPDGGHPLHRNQFPIFLQHVTAFLND